MFPNTVPILIKDTFPFFVFISIFPVVPTWSPVLSATIPALKYFIFKSTGNKEIFFESLSRSNNFQILMF